MEVQGIIKYGTLDVTGGWGQQGAAARARLTPFTQAPDASNQLCAPLPDVGAASKLYLLCPVNPYSTTLC